MDPFVLAHQVGPMLYDLSGGIYPSSIRDQVLRAFVFVERALDSGLLRPDQTLLIVGAGAAGATAALTAARAGVRTTLAERKDGPFHAQFGAQTRFVCPTQYDWPCSHWTKAHFPWTTPKPPLTWHAGRASVVVGIWKSRLNELIKLKRVPNLKVLYRTNFLTNYNIVQNPQGAHEVAVHFDPPQPREPLHYDMAISCVGFGSEKCTVKSYTGYSFWDADKFEEAGLGMDGRLRPRVLISGGGDGALQDFLRIITNQKCASDIYKRLPHDAKLEIERKIYSAEDQAHRSYIWGTDDIWPHDHRTHEWLHKKYREVIHELVLGPHWPAVERALSQMLKDSPERLNVKLVFPCTHFSQCYPLNRFLALLFAEFFNYTHHTQVLHPKTKVVEVRGVAQHVCHNSPPSCYGEEHEIFYVPVFCESFKSAGADRGEYKVVEGGPYNLVVIRHGIEPPRAIFRKRPPVLRQPLPYFIDY